MSLVVHYLQPDLTEALDHLRSKLAPGIRLTVGPGQPIPPDMNILIAGRPEREHLEAGPFLHTLIIPWSGLPEPTRQLMVEFPEIAVHNLHHNAAPVSELAFALLLAAAKFIVPLDRSLRSHDWRPRYRPSPSMLLAGKTALILGYGSIGRRLARLCRAIGMRVLAIRKSQGHGNGGLAGEVHPASSLPALLPLTNALLICLPHTRETTGMIGPVELALLPNDAVLVNVGRGAIVDEEALFNTLRDGRLLAAGLDVWYNYPTEEKDRAHNPPSDFPFHDLENVVMSPHRGGATSETNHLRMSHLARLLNAAARGGVPPNRVDIQAGY